MLTPLYNLGYEISHGRVYGRYYKGKGNNNRVRFSTGLEATKTNIKYVKANLEMLAREHFESKLENKSIVLVDDIAEIAIREDEDNRFEDTTNDYLSLYTRFVKPAIGKLNIKDIKPSHINAIKAQCVKDGMSQSYFNRIYRVLRFILNYAYNNDMIEHNPIHKTNRNSKGLKKPIRMEDKLVYTPEEMKKVANARVPKNLDFKDEEMFRFSQLFMMMSYTTMARTGSIMPLLLSDIDFENKTIQLTKSIRKGRFRNELKTGNRGAVPLHPVVEKLLNHWIVFLGNKRTPYVFANLDTQEPFTDSAGITKRNKKFLKHIGVEYKTNIATRRSGASALALNGVPVQVIQKQLMHSSMQTTMDYYLTNSLVTSDLQYEAVKSLEI